MSDVAMLLLPDGSIMKFTKKDGNRIEVGAYLYSLIEARKLWYSRLERGAIVYKKVMQDARCHVDLDLVGSIVKYNAFIANTRTFILENDWNTKGMPSAQDLSDLNPWIEYLLGRMGYCDIVSKIDNDLNTGEELKYALK